MEVRERFGESDHVAKRFFPEASPELCLKTSAKGRYDLLAIFGPLLIKYLSAVSISHLPVDSCESGVDNLRHVLPGRTARDEGGSTSLMFHLRVQPFQSGDHARRFVQAALKLRPFLGC